MKTLKNITYTILSLCLFLACDTNNSSDDTPEEQQVEATFFTLGGVTPGDESVEQCGEPPIFLNIQEGSGEATQLGQFTTRITFCVDATDVLDGQLTEGESVPYFDGEGTFTAENGDELHFTIEGEILPTEAEGYDFEFMDPFIFTGGTGRFEGATGEGVTNSHVIMSEGKTDHVWTGTITLQKK